MNIYVGNLAYGVTSEKLQELFEEFGTVQSANVIKDRATGQSKGFGFIEMENNSEADAAIKALNGQDVDGRKIKISQANPREKRSPRGGGRRF